MFDVTVYWYKVLLGIRKYFRGRINLGWKKLVKNYLYMEAFIASVPPSQPASLNKQNVKDSELLISHNVGDNCRVPIFYVFL